MMVRRALLILVASLLAVAGTDLAAACASSWVIGVQCCCPVEGPPPCLTGGQGSDSTMPESDAVLDSAPSLQVADLPSTTTPTAPWPTATRPAVVDPDADAPAALSPRLLACVWLC